MSANLAVVSVRWCGVPLRAPRPRRSSPTLPSAALRYRQVAAMSNDQGESAGRDRLPSGPRSPLRYIHDLIASSSWPTRAAPWPWLLKVLSSRIGGYAPFAHGHLNVMYEVLLDVLSNCNNGWCLLIVILGC